MMESLNKTKMQLESLGYPIIGIQLKSGLKQFGRVVKFTPHTIYFKDRNGDVLDAPRKIIERAFLLLEGEEEDGEEATSVFGQG